MREGGHTQGQTVSLTMEMLKFVIFRTWEARAIDPSVRAQDVVDL